LKKRKLFGQKWYPVPSFLIDEKKMFLLNICYMMISENEKYNLRYLLTLLNSNLLFWIFKQISPKLYGKRLRFIKQYVEEFPI
jgi:hypothetical protein